ncbi:enoyl-CoA hydratase [Sneathiella chungangensis]|uniref:Enoyl-CoA hydratase n=1 Tax=Sneathiella chungangensis TaxID=1418234 RepID=A0A845MGY2_9PROT|nr:enoyl-CoA hydratase [Sneathiella chungangensis]
MDKLIVEVRQHIATLTLNAPITKNALSDPDVCLPLIQKFDQFSQNLNVHCIILTGTGDVFCSGGNIKDIRDKKSIFAGDSLEVMDQYRSSVQRLAKAIWNCKLPVIAAVNGPAYGAGCDLAMMADIRIAAPTASFAENFLELGLISGDGGSWLLPKQIGLSRAAEMTFTADPVDAATALKWGLVSSVVPGKELLASANSLAARIARHPPQQLRASKRLMRESLQSGLDNILDMAAIYQGVFHQTREHKESVNALIERRAPIFNRQTGDAKRF